MKTFKLILGRFVELIIYQPGFTKTKKVISLWTPFLIIIGFNTMKYPKKSIHHFISVDFLVLKVKFNWYRNILPINSITVCVYAKVKLPVWNLLED